MAEIKFVDHWNEYLAFFQNENKDIYYTEEYVRLYETKTEKAKCFIYKEGDKCLIFPYLLRHFDFEGKEYYDFETAYGYGGPISNCEDDCFVNEALQSFLRFGQEHGYVAGFVRFHPLLRNDLYCASLGRIIPDRFTIAIDLRADIENVWKNEIHSQNRNVIRKGAKNGLVFVADYEFRYLKEFIALYNGTMDKLSADGFYYFEDSYYEHLKDQISNKFLGIVLEGDEVISAAIYFYEGIYGHYHLSGSNREKLRLCPNNFMLWEAAKELKRQGVQSFHLGGGINSDEQNNLFLFKKRFSKSLHQFSIGKIVFNEKVYASVCDQWGQNNPDKAGKYAYFLLKYKY